MSHILACHYCGEAVSLSALRVLDVPIPTGDGRARSAPAPHCPTCAIVVEALEALNAAVGRAHPASAES